MTITIWHNPRCSKSRQTLELLRKKLGKKKADLSRADIAKAIAAHPILLQRPLVVSGKRAAIGRPPEAVLALLK
jgi:arsenate reductase (glutaredoxin)